MKIIRKFIREYKEIVSKLYLMYIMAVTDKEKEKNDKKKSKA